MTVVFLFTLYLYYIFVVFNLSKNLFPFLSKRTAKLRHFFELTKYFKKNIYFFLFKLLLLNSLRRVRLKIVESGCKITKDFSNLQIFSPLFSNLFFQPIARLQKLTWKSRHIFSKNACLLLNSLAFVPESGCKSTAFFRTCNTYHQKTAEFSTQTFLICTINQIY